MSAAPDSLGREAGSAVRWNAAGAALSLLSQLAQLVVLARLLAPQEFGLAAAALGVTGFAQGFADLGLGNALVQRDGVDDMLWSNSLRACAGTGLALCVFVIALSPGLAGLLHLPGLPPLLAVAALALPWVGLATVYQAEAQRGFHFSRLAAAEMLASLVSMAAALGWAWWRHDAMAVVMGQIALAATRCLALAWKSRISFFRGPWRLAVLKPLASFGGYQLGERAFNAAAGNLDRLLVARWLGPAAAGYYTLGSQIALRPKMLLAPFAFRTLFPLLSRLQADRARLASSFLRAVSLLCFSAAGIYAILGGLSQPLVHSVLGPHWEPVSPVLRVLTGLGFIWTASQPLASVTLALGRARTSFWLNLLALVTNAVGVLCGVHFGIIGAAWGMLAAAAVLLPIDIYLIRYWLHIPVRRFLAASLRPLPAAICTAAAAAGMAALPFWTGWPRFGAITVQAILACLVYAAASGLLNHKGWCEAWVEIRSKLRP